MIKKIEAWTIIGPYGISQRHRPMHSPKERASPRLSVVSNELHKKMSLPEMLTPILSAPPPPRNLYCHICENAVAGVMQGSRQSFPLGAEQKSVRCLGHPTALGASSGTVPISSVVVEVYVEEVAHEPPFLSGTTS